MPAAQIAAQFGIARDSVRQIVRGKYPKFGSRKSRIKEEVNKHATAANH